MHITNAEHIADLLPRLESAARRAGDIALAHFRPGERTTAAVSYKNGGSPVTEADLAVDRFLHAEMQRLAPQAGWLSEETTDTDARLSQSSLFVVDPIDGTSAFTRGDARWAISIALVEAGRPVMGVVHAPALQQTFSGAAGVGAFLNGDPLAVAERASLDGATVIAPRSMHEQIESSPLKFIIAPRVPSLALRLVDLAAGRHDLVLTTPNSRDWDIAAADIILAEAGATLTEAGRAPLIYNRPNLARGALIAAATTLIDDAVELARTLSREPFYS
jgi:myo-inositol-1(or 4)-monophosphatase